MVIDVTTSAQLLGLADQFMEDWAENEGENDEECVERRHEYDLIRPLWAHAPILLDLLYLVLHDTEGQALKPIPQSLSWAQHCAGDARVKTDSRN